MTELWQCTLCDETVEESGRVGHLKFKDEDSHGGRMEMPDGYDDNPEDFFVKAEDASGSESSSDPEPEPDESGEEEIPVETPDESGTGNGQSTGTDEPTGAIGKLKAFLLKDVRDL